MNYNQRQNKRITPFIKHSAKIYNHRKQHSFMSASTKSSLMNPSLKKTASINSEFDKIKK